MTPKQFRHLLPALALAATALGAAPALAVTTFEPGEAASKDVLLHESDGPRVFGIPTPPRRTNLASVTLNAISPPPAPCRTVRGSAEADPFSLTPGGPLRATARGRRCNSS